MLDLRAVLVVEGATVILRAYVTDRNDHSRTSARHLGSSTRGGFGVHLARGTALMPGGRGGSA
jgi:hypothetical protein